ncbi:metalloproteinase inhibitor 4-like [Protobothrops mucrosquamatus]|uniref:metalloproteinase inhibitor 4-like n=1 Tax=Protobothrops mucrosquamatus TaxID=103944 RepID=UPI0007759648|nr:metalloproteinase inhibitor 4-like [Protobothrops mucrosquamatus]
MNPLFNTLLFSPLFLLTLNIRDPTEACSCMPAHPQEQICNSNIVILANIQSKTVVEDSYSLKIIKYEVKQIKMFKGFEKVKDVQYVFTPLTEASCGVKLKVRKKKKNQYLLSGKMGNDGRIFISLCGFIKPWNKLTVAQKTNLHKNYEMGCDCKIIGCPVEPCPITISSVCLWTDWLKEQTFYGHQAKNCACFKDSDGACSWHHDPSISEP